MRKFKGQPLPVAGAGNCLLIEVNFVTTSLYCIRENYPSKLWF